MDANDSAKLLHSSGLLFEINRRVLHPLGLALVVRTSDDAAVGWELQGLQDERADPEGIIFSREQLQRGEAKLREYLAHGGQVALDCREKALGYIEQPLAGEVDPHACTRGVLAAVLRERIRQDTKWGVQEHPDGTSLAFSGNADAARNACARAAWEGRLTWLDIMHEEVAEAAAEEDLSRLSSELVQVAAVAVAWVEAIGRRVSSI